MSSDASERKELLAALGGKLRRMGIVTVMFHQVVGEKLGLNVTDSRALSLLDELGPMPAGRLAELTGLSRGAVTTIIDRLEQAGFVRRASDPADRRRVIVEPVHDEERERRKARLFGPLFSGLVDAMARYSDDELVLILDFIERGTDFLRGETVKLRDQDAGGGTTPLPNEDDHDER